MPKVMALLFTVTNSNPSHVFTNKWINKIHTMEYSAIKWNEILIHATIWMNLENMLTEISQTQKDKYFTIPFIRDT